MISRGFRCHSSEIPRSVAVSLFFVTNLCCDGPCGGSYFSQRVTALAVEVRETQGRRPARLDPQRGHHLLLFGLVAFFVFGRGGVCFWFGVPRFEVTDSV